jgi:hypothetical protein
VGLTLVHNKSSRLGKVTPPVQAKKKEEEEEENQHQRQNLHY